MLHRSSLLLFALCAAFLAVAQAQQNDTSFQWARVARGLRNPRHMSFGKGSDRHHLYIAEAGLGSNTTVEDSVVCFPSQESPATQCFGLTGAITRVDLRTLVQRRVVDGLPSIADVPANSTDDSVIPGSGALGPSSVSTVAPFCAEKLGKEDEEEDLDEPFDESDDSTTANRGAAPLVFGVTACTNKDSFAELQAADVDLRAFGKLLQYHEQADGSFEWTVGADVCKYELENDVDGSGADSNPHDLISLRHSVSGDIYHLVADAGANDVLAVDHSTGRIKHIAVFPSRSLIFNNDTFEVQAVPTSLTRVGDSVIVGQLTGFPFVPKSARLFRLSPSADGWSVLASDFTNVVSVTHDGDGNIYVLEMLAKGLNVGASGGDFRVGLLKVTPEGEISRLLPCLEDNDECEDLVFGGGLAYHNRILYVSHKAVSIDGEVVAIPLDDLPEYDASMFTI